MQSGTNVMIFKIFSPKNSAKKLAFLTLNKGKLCKILIITLVFEKNAIFFAENCRKLQKIEIITSTPGCCSWYISRGMFWINGLLIYRTVACLFVTTCWHKQRLHCSRPLKVCFCWSARPTNRAMDSKQTNFVLFAAAPQKKTFFFSIWFLSSPIFHFNLDLKKLGFKKVWLL
jgi:hypothetical protein